MKKVILMLCLAVIAAISVLTVSSADTMSSSAMMSASSTATIVTPDNIKWMPAKGMPGLQEAVLYGDPMKAGSVYTWRLKLPDGYKFPMHWHPDTERVTVLSGSILFGVGMSKGTILPAGSFIVIPARVHHWATAKGATVLQSSGTGPFAMTLVK